MSTFTIAVVGPSGPIDDATATQLREAIHDGRDRVIGELGLNPSNVRLIFSIRQLQFARLVRNLARGENWAAQPVLDRYDDIPMMGVDADALLYLNYHNQTSAARTEFEHRGKPVYELSLTA